MRRRLPPLSALRAFEAAARLGSFSRAAEELLVTHGAISRQVQGLEARLGVALFRRFGRRVEPTEAGRTYQQALGAAFDEIAAATERLAATAGKGRSLIVNALPTFTMRWLIPRLARFQRAHPEVELRLVTSSRPVAAPADGFDVAIRRGPESWPGCRAAPFLIERELPVCSPSLLARRPIRAPGDLVSGGHVLLHADTRPNAWARWLEAAGVPAAKAAKAPAQHFDHFYLTLQAASDGLGVALGPLPIIDDDLAAGHLVAPLDGPAAPARSYYWVTPESRAAAPEVTAFCGWLTVEGAAASDDARPAEASAEP
jgi:LysR family transcriptional regulator, glycine cleavage system transcriptional activator